MILGMITERMKESLTDQVLTWANESFKKNCLSSIHDLGGLNPFD